MLRDFRTAWRSLFRSPLFTFAATGSLALGIGACTVIFSVVYALLLRPLPYPKPAELVHIGMGNPAFPSGAFGFLSTGTFKSLRHAKDSGLAALGGFGYDYANLTGVPTPTQLTVGLVTADYFRVYGMPAQLGRTFVDADCHVESPAVVLITDHLWRTQFNAAAEIVGRSVTLDNKPRTVIGVMPAGFKDLNEGCDFWQPLAEDGPEMASDARRRYITTARLTDDSEATRARLRVVLSTMSANLAQTDTLNNKGWHLECHPLGGNLLIGAGATQALWLLLGAVGCVLLVTCANVANLQLVRAAGRTKELAVHVALGAGRGRLVRQLLTESAVLGLLGGLLGLLVASWAMDAIGALSPAGIPRFHEARLDWIVLAFVAAVASGTGVLVGLWPAWRVSGVATMAAALHENGARGSTGGASQVRARSVLVVVQVALALVLLIGAGLALQSSKRLVPAIRDVVRALDPSLPVSDVATLDEHIASSMVSERLTTVRATPGSAARRKGSDQPSVATVRPQIALFLAWLAASNMGDELHPTRRNLTNKMR